MSNIVFVTGASGTGKTFVLRVTSVGDLLERVMHSPVDLKQRRSC